MLSEELYKHAFDAALLQCEGLLFPANDVQAMQVRRRSSA